MESTQADYDALIDTPENPENIDTNALSTAIATDIPKHLKVEVPQPYSRTLQVSLAAGATSPPIVFSEEIDGWLVYMVNNTNQFDRVLVSARGVPGAEDDDILTPGKSTVLMYEGGTLYLRNTSANAHVVVVKAFRDWLPFYN